MKVRFTVPGEPFGKQRPVVVDGNAFTPKKTVIYENLVKTEYERQCRGQRFPDNAVLDARITAYYSIPKSTSKKKRQMMLDHRIRPSKTPDTDNIAKAILDSGNGIIYKDDKQVVDLQVRKFYSEQPRVVVTIQEATSY